MTDDDRKLGERVAALEARFEAIPSNGELLDVAGSAGQMKAAAYMDGLTKSFQQQTNARLEALEKLVTKMRGHMVIVNAVMLIIGFVVGQKIPPFIP